MPTALDIVTDALNLIGVAGVSENASSEDAKFALDALNDMIFAWELKGVDVSHTALGLTSTFALDDKFVEATKYLLGQRLSRLYGRPPPDPLITDDGWRALQAAYWAVPTVKVDAGLLKMPSQFSDGNDRQNT